METGCRTNIHVEQASPVKNNDKNIDQKFFVPPETIETQKHFDP